VVERAVSKSVVPLTGDRGFESVSLQRRIHCEPDFLRSARRSGPTPPDRQLSSCSDCLGPAPEIDPLQGRTQLLRLVEVAVVVDPAANARVAHLGQVLQGLVAAMMKRPAPNGSADGRQRLRTGGGQEARKGLTSPSPSLPRSERKPEKVERLVWKVAPVVRIYGLNPATTALTKRIGQYPMAR
jgi:hypothetical protein